MENLEETNEIIEDTNPKVYIIRAFVGKEDKLILTLKELLEKKGDLSIYSLFKPETVKGYLFCECENLQGLKDLLRGVPNNLGVVKNPVNEEELNKYFEKGGETVIVNEKDLVEIIVGPFKGDKAKVLRVVTGKEEVVVEPINMPVPIPITLNIDDIRVIKNKNEEKNKNDN
jgi:transcription termination/antitermination protein NusG